MKKASTRSQSAAVDSTPSASREPDRPGNIPVFISRHRGLKAAVWRNDLENGPMFNTTVSRTYKDGDAWKESGSFGYDDLLIVAELLRTCHGYISREFAKAALKAP